MPFGTGDIFTGLLLALCAKGIACSLIGISVNRKREHCYESLERWWAALCHLIELACRLVVADRDPRATIMRLKPGVVKTNICREFPRWMQWLVPLVFDPLLAQAPQEAAESALSLLLAEDLKRVAGALFLKIRKLKRVVPTARARDPEEGRRLWKLSERLTTKGLCIVANTISSLDP